MLSVIVRVNPFEFPRGVYSKDNIPKETPQTLSLEAIFTVKGQKIATISGQNFVKGDFSFGKRVAQIFKNRVVLDDGGKEENLILEDTNFTIRKHMQNLLQLSEQFLFLRHYQRLIVLRRVICKKHSEYI
jgi:hypothetical protein